MTASRGSMNKNPCTYLTARVLDWQPPAERAPVQELSADSCQVGADMEARNSPLDLVLVRRLSRSSMASTVESGLMTLRRTQTRVSSSGGSRSSDLRAR